MDEPVPVQTSPLENPSVAKPSGEAPRIEYQESPQLIEGMDDFSVALSYSADLEEESSMDLIKDEDEDDNASLFEGKNNVQPEPEKVKDIAMMKPEAPELS